MTIEEIKNEVTKICKEQGVEHLYLFGSYATGTATKSSDIDFIVKGITNFDLLKELVDKIRTLTEIDLFDYDNCNNAYLKKAMDKYGRIIY